MFEHLFSPVTFISSGLRYFAAGRTAMALPFVLTALLAAFLASPVTAGPAIPSLRYQAYLDTDYYGSDLQALFDTDLASCQRACSAQ
jgi:hypothetical protein